MYLFTIIFIFNTGSVPPHSDKIKTSLNSKVFDPINKEIVINTTQDVANTANHVIVVCK